jgi:hypothetical protein
MKKTKEFRRHLRENDEKHPTQKKYEHTSLSLKMKNEEKDEEDKPTTTTTTTTTT